MLEDLLQKKVIELPECKRPEEMDRVNDLNYCHYHPSSCGDMFRFKRSHNETLHLDLDEVVESNHATVTFGLFDHVPLHVPLKKLGASASTIQCESPKP